MRKASSILLLVFLFMANVSFAHGRHGSCSSAAKSCCKKETKSCCEKKEVKSCCEKKAKSCGERYHDGANCGYCQNKSHDCMTDCQQDPCPSHHCDGCYSGEGLMSGIPDAARGDHHCDGCHPMDKW